MSALSDLTNLAPTDEKEPPFFFLAPGPPLSSSGAQTSATIGLHRALHSALHSALHDVSHGALHGALPARGEQRGLEVGVERVVVLVGEVGAVVDDVAGEVPH